MRRFLIAIAAVVFSALPVAAQTNPGNGVWIGAAPGGAGGGTLSFFGSPVINDLTKVYSSTQITNAVPCTDYPSPPIGSSILAGNGSGCFANITVGSGLLLSGTTLSATGSGGSVTSVGLTAPGIFTVSGSPVTTSGTLALGLATQSPNMVWAGPTGGGAATPTFRSLIAADLPNDIAYFDKNQSWTAAQRNPSTTLTPSGATYTPNFDTGQNFTMTLVHASCPCTLANPSTTLVSGQTGVIQINQSATGSDTIGTWGSEYTSANGTASIALSTTANARDYFSYYVADSGHIVLSLAVPNATH